MGIKLKRPHWIGGIVLVAVISGSVVLLSSDQKCPTPETFVRDFTNFSIELLDANPGYAEKEQRYYWQEHLEEMGCIESQDIIDNAICADCNEDGTWTDQSDNATST